MRRPCVCERRQGVLSRSCSAPNVSQKNREYLSRYRFAFARQQYLDTIIQPFWIKVTL